jgi:hypothetical protein
VTTTRGSSRNGERVWPVTTVEKNIRFEQCNQRVTYSALSVLHPEQFISNTYRLANKHVYNVPHSLPCNSYQSPKHCIPRRAHISTVNMLSSAVFMFIYNRQINYFLSHLSCAELMSENCSNLLMKLIRTTGTHYFLLNETHIISKCYTSSYMS